MNATYTAASGNGSKIVINGNGKIDTSFMRLVGVPDIGFDVSATSAWGNVRMRVAMALDVTGSMAQDGKMPAMQTAAKSLIDQLSPLAKNPGDIYISVVPFAKDVNFGSSYYNQTYIDWSCVGRPTRMGRAATPATRPRVPAKTPARPGRRRPQQMDRLRHRPHAGLRHQEHEHRPRPMRRRWSLPRNTSPAPQNTASRAPTPICSRSCR